MTVILFYINKHSIFILILFNFYFFINFQIISITHFVKSNGPQNEKVKAQNLFQILKKLDSVLPDEELVYMV